MRRRAKERCSGGKGGEFKKAWVYSGRASALRIVRAMQPGEQAGQVRTPQDGDIKSGLVYVSRRLRLNLAARDRG